MQNCPFLQQWKVRQYNQLYKGIWNLLPISSTKRLSGSRLGSQRKKLASQLLVIHHSYIFISVIMCYPRCMNDGLTKTIWTRTRHFPIKYRKTSAMLLHWMSLNEHQFIQNLWFTGRLIRLLGMTVSFDFRYFFRLTANSRLSSFHLLSTNTAACVSTFEHALRLPCIFRRYAVKRKISRLRST